ncbi:DUF4037 domain-containing protein [Actinoplanes subglobosus]|uniref:DUF4037 domain-containing protein n=1 Tax=Actinoplanes subglobosus TaxID=1547892 RepID=A0ABV8J7Z8_9ACTN
MPPQFVPGLRLCRTFYDQAVRPLLDDTHPGLPHAAARIGPGSEVLGFDTPRSADHDWGPRLELFLRPEDVARHGDDLSAMLTARLPKHIGGWPTNFEPADARVRVMTATDGPVAHRVHITDVATWSTGLLGFDARSEPTTLDWLATPTQRLAETVGGAVFHDGIGDLTALRERLRWYPDDVWRQVLAAQWARIGQEEAFVGRAAETGDDLGSRIVAARLARDVMRLVLLLARRFPPYSKWLGKAFTALPEAAGIAAALHDALAAGDAGRRQASLCAAYEMAGDWQNRLGIAESVDATRRPYFDRPFPVIDAGRFVRALTGGGPAGIGGIDQFSDCTDVLEHPDLTRKIMRTVVHSDARRP